MEFDWDKFIKAYQTTSKENRLFIDSGVIADSVQQLITEGIVAPKHHQIIVTALSHHALQVTPENEIIKILESAGIANPISIFAKTINSQKIEPPKKNNDLRAEISAAEHDLESIHSIRTMAHDMQEAKIHPVTHPTTPETTYQSSQDDLLKQIETMAKPSTAPRWDTEA